MSRQVWFRSFLIVASVLLCALYASADSRARIVRLSYVDGKVQLDRGDGRGLQSAFLNMPVSEGTSIVTGDDSKAEVQFEDGSNIRLVPDSEIDFPQLGLRSNGAKFTTVELKDGGAYFNFHKHDKDEFLLHVANRQVQLQHSSSFRVELDHGAMKLAVLNGEVKVSGDGAAYFNFHKHDKDEFLLHVANRQVQLQHSSSFRVELDHGAMKLAVLNGEVKVSGDGAETLAVKKNETFSLDPSDDRYFLAKEISSEPWDQWK